MPPTSASSRSPLSASETSCLRRADVRKNIQIILARQKMMRPQQYILSRYAPFTCCSALRFWRCHLIWCRRKCAQTLLHSPQNWASSSPGTRIKIPTLNKGSS